MEPSRGHENPAYLPDTTGSSKTISKHPGHQNGVAAGHHHKGVSPVASPEKDIITTCGIGPCTPRACHVFAKIHWFVALLSIYSFIEGASINGFVNISLATLETRFQLQSSETGLIVSSADIGATVFVLFVSYYGAKTHQPRVIGAGCLVMALGAFLFLLPHLLVGTYEYGSGGDGVGHVCDPERTDVCATTQDEDSPASAYLPLFAIANAVQGIGFTPAFTVGAAYIDDNTTPEKTAFFMGIVYAMTALGVAAGFMSGGQLLNTWVDVGRVDTSLIDIDPSDRRWVGAWWIGFVITCILFVVFTLPLCAFPKRLQGSRKARIPAKKVDDSAQKSLWERIISFPKSMWILVKNPIFVLILLAGSAETLVIQGLTAFAAKILEEKFNFNPADAGLVMGGVALVGGAGGMVLGGFLIKRFHLQLTGIMKLCMVMSLLALALGAGFFLNCPESRFAGLSWDYVQDNTTLPAKELTGVCNALCNCNTQDFDPVCGSDGVVYFSPCHAGCDENILTNASIKTFTNCSCIHTSITDPVSTVSPIDLKFDATSGPCATDCSLVWLFIVLLFLAILATFTTVTPISMAVLRCAPEEERSLGLGMQWVSLRLLGTIPGPVLTGAILDNACDLWQETCSGQGSCWVYNREAMSWTLFAWWAAVKVLTFLFLFIALHIHRRQQRYGVPPARKQSFTISTRL